MAVNAKLVNMTSTEVYKTQVSSIIEKMRHENTTTDPNILFVPTHLGGALGQKEIIDGRNVMRKIIFSPD